MEPRYYYLLPNLIAAFCMLYLLGLIWKRRIRRGGLPIALLTAGAAVWAGAEGMLYLDLDQATRILITQIQYLGICTVPAAMFTFVLIYVGRVERLTPGFLAGVYLLPAVILGLAWTDGYHHLIWSRMWTDTTGSFPMLALVHGPAYWVYAAYCYIALAAAGLLLWGHAAQGPAMYRSQSRLILATIMVPWVCNMVYLSGHSPVPNLDLTAVSFALLTVPLAVSFLRYRLLDLIPVARTTVFQGLSSGVLVIDHENRVLDMNPAAGEVLGRNIPRTVGRRLEEVLTGEPDLAEALCRTDESRREIRVEGRVDEACYEVRSTPLKDRRGTVLGRLVVMEDISERKALEDELRRLAATDPLTGLANRRSFLDLGQREVARCRRSRRPACLLMIDIDHFKLVNDRHGHLQGDRVLTALADAFRELLRQSDLVARMGGEEFAALLPEISLQEGMEVAERLRLAAVALLGRDGEELPGFTISIGVAGLDRNGDNLDGLLARADTALYQAKAAGRNTCRCFQYAESTAQPA